jgi:hypothetical protein
MIVYLIMNSLKRQMQFRLKKLRNDLIMILDKNKIFEDFFDDINIEDDVKTEEIL